MSKELLQNEYSVMELDTDVMRSLKQAPNQSAENLAKTLRMDPHAVRKILKSLENDRLVYSSEQDGNPSFRLTHNGRNLLKISDIRTRSDPSPPDTIAASAPRAKPYTNG